MKRVVYTSPYIPVEWIAAHGLNPCRITPCTSSPGSEIMRTERLCPYVRDFINNLKKEKDCGAVFATVCDQMRRGFDIVSSRLEMPSFLMNVTSTWQTVTSQKLYLDELKRLGKFLVQLGGKIPSNDTLSEIMIKYDAARKSLLVEKDILNAKQFAENIEQFGRNNPDVNCRMGFSPCGKGIPLAIVGGPLLKQNFDLLEIIERLGGRIVLNATENGERGLCAPFNQRNLKENPLFELADAYFNSIYDASKRPNSELYKWLKKMFAEREIRGIIFHRNIWCDIWHAELHRLKEWINVPVLDIESTGDDDSTNQGNINRIRAFLEMIN